MEENIPCGHQDVGEIYLDISVVMNGLLVDVELMRTSMFRVALPLALGVLLIPSGTLLPSDYGSTESSMDRWMQGEPGLLHIGNNLLGHCKSTDVSSQYRLGLFAK